MEKESENYMIPQPQTEIDRYGVEYKIARITVCYVFAWQGFGNGEL